MSDTNLAQEPSNEPLPQSLGDLAGASSAPLVPDSPPAGDRVRSSFDSLLDRVAAPVDPAVQGQFVDLQQRKMDAYDQQQQREERLHGEDRVRVKQAMDLQQATIDHTPKWDAEAEKAKYKTDPIAEFGSFASVFAMVASAFTKAPMVNALNGAAAAINAKRENNEKEYDRALEAWKVNTDLAVKRFNMQHAALGDAFTLMDKDQVRGRAKALEVMTKFGMEKELLMYENGMFPEIQQHQDAQLKAIEGVMRARTAWDHNEDQKKRTELMAKRDDLRGEIERTKIEAARETNAEKRADAQRKLDLLEQKMADSYNIAQERTGIQQQNADTAAKRVAAAATKAPVVTKDRIEAEEIKRRKGELEAEGKGPAEALAQAEQESTARTDKGMTANRRDQLRVYVSQYDQQLREVDRAITLIEKYGDVGIGGKLKRGAQTVGNLIGASNRTDARQVEAALSELRLRAPALLTQSNANSPRIKAAYELIENVIPGLEMGATGQAVLDQLKHLKVEFAGFRKSTQERIDTQPGGSATSSRSSVAPAAKPAESKDDWWKAGVPVQ